MFNMAEEARNRRDFERCIEILERASRLDPANVQILLNLGHAHGTHYNFAAAQRYFERAIRIAPNRTEILASAGMRARDFGDHKLAEYYYRLALQQKDVTPITLVNLAEICERLSRVDEAGQLVSQALHLQPGFPAALLVEARLDRMAGRLEEAEKLLRSFPTTADRDSRARSLYELGGVLDRQGRYDEAMSAFLEAKALLRVEASGFVAERQKMRSRLKQLREGLTAETLNRWLEERSWLEPPDRLALLCGHPRSGTTLLEQVLDSHPDVVSAEETDIFHNEAYLPLLRAFPDSAPIQSSLDSATIESLQNSRKNYLHAVEAFLGGSIGGRLLVDKNPSLTYLLAAMIRVFPEVKVLVAVRDPRDVCLSCFMQPFVPVGQTSSAYLDLESTVEEYVELMEMCRTVVSCLSNSILEVRYEDIVDDLLATSGRVLEFLGLSWDESVLRFDEHARQKLVRSPTYADVTKPVFKTAIGRWRHYEKHLAPHFAPLGSLLKILDYE